MSLQRSVHAQAHLEDCILCLEDIRAQRSQGDVDEPRSAARESIASNAVLRAKAALMIAEERGVILQDCQTQVRECL